LSEIESAYQSTVMMMMMDIATDVNGVLSSDDLRRPMT